MKPVQVEDACVASEFKDPKMRKSHMRHLRLGHIGHDGINAIVKQKLVIGISEQVGALQWICSWKADAGKLSDNCNPASQEPA